MDCKKVAEELRVAAEGTANSVSIGRETLNRWADEIDKPTKPTLAWVLNKADGYTITAVNKRPHLAVVRSVNGKTKLGEVEVTLSGSTIFRLREGTHAFTLDPETIHALSDYIKEH